MTIPQLTKPALALLITVLITVILLYAKPFLVPLAFGAVLSMLLLPIVEWLQRKNVPHVVAILIAIFILVAFFALVILFLSWQIADFAKNASTFEQQLTAKYEALRQSIAQQFNISPEKQKEMMAQQKSGSSGGMGSFITGLIAGTFGFLADTILVLVYIFLMIFFRKKLKGFVVKMVSQDQAANAVKTIGDAQKICRKYITGLFLMIVCLWIMYTIGFTIAGVKNAFFFAIICGLLELVPFVGNLLGTALTLGMSMASGGGSNMVIGILITYVAVQFIQTYLLEPLVVGEEVNINPLFTIIGLVAGEALWGIPGMILAIPLLGISKIICEHVKPLRPYAYLIGSDKKESKGFKKKMQELFRKSA